MKTNSLESVFAKQTGSGDEILFDDSGFTFEYQQYAAPLTEAPERYHSFASLAVVATVVGRKVWLAHGARNIYPNIWVALVGKSSQLKKSTALRIASDLIDAHNRKLLFPEDFSREALYEALQEQPAGLFVWNELGGVLKNFEAGYMTGTKELLTELFDCPPAKVRKLKGAEIVIRDACPSVLCASTVDWLTGNMSQVDLRSGFAARFIYVPADESSKILPIPPPRDMMLMDGLIARMGRMSELEGEMTLSHSASVYYDTWYRTMHRDIGRLPDASKVHSFASRLQTYALKLAMLYQIARDYRLCIEEDAIWRGCQACEWLFAEAQKLVDEELACSDRERDVRDVANHIMREKVVRHSNLLRAFRKHRARDLDDILKNLMESEQIRKGKADRSIIYTWVGEGAK